jgi:hypothetical protein
VRASEPSSDSRAREHPFLETVAERVEYISELMAANVWNPETTKLLRKELASTWDCATSTILNYSAEAHRTRLDDVRERRAEVARKAVNALLEVAEGKVVMPGDRAAKVAASKTLLEFAGLDKPDEDKIQKHMIAGVADATPAKAREVMLGLFGAVTPDANRMAEPDLERDAGEGVAGVPKRTP